MTAQDPGREFEQRALALARAIHDPLGLQGAEMILGRERDGVFITEDAIHVYEFTTLKTKAKAQQDANKIVEALRHLQKEPVNRYKTATGWFVTQGEPDAVQRETIRKISQSSGFPIQPISATVLRGRLCDVEGYLARRGDAPFGSVAYTQTSQVQVPPHVECNGRQLGVKDLAQELASGARFALVGEFGVGKSHALRELYTEVRKRYFRGPMIDGFPLHINLRDCYGLRTPAEILRRHAEEIGFDGERGLISAWRAGSCVMLLDGFDEVIPSRWLGSATNLRSVRWEALSPVRRLIQEAPKGIGIIVAGRGHYFSTEDEMLEALGMSGALTARMHDFDEEQATQFLKAAGSTSELPDWLPTRPLLLAHLALSGALEDVAAGRSADPPTAWRDLLNMICVRESNMYESVPPSTIRDVIVRLATVARATGDPLGPLQTVDLERVFYDVTGRNTVDEEVIQLLLRLPGLATAGSGVDERRIFVDESLASVAYGEDLASYLISPHQGHPLCEPATWSEAANWLAVDVASLALSEMGIGATQTSVAGEVRMNRSQFDAVLFDAIQVSDSLGTTGRGSAYIVEGLLAEHVAPAPENTALGRTHFRDCVIEQLDLGGAESTSIPTFERCLIPKVVGVSDLPHKLSSNFIECEISSYDAPAETTDSVMNLPMNIEEKIALSILHKVYAKRGGGRRDSALPRGLDPAVRDKVGSVANQLVTAGLLSTSSRGNVTIYLPVRAQVAHVREILSDPQRFSFPN